MAKRTEKDRHLSEPASDVRFGTWNQSDARQMSAAMPLSGGKKP
jgi:hypothetical protein